MEMQAQKTRMAYVDNIRWLMIVMVVAMHACVTYSGIGDWIYREPKVLDIPSQLVFSFYQVFAQGFFMGILFLIAGTFIPRAYDRKGFGGFLRDRLFRLGLPTLIYMLLLDPLTRIIMRAFEGYTVSLAGVAQWYAEYVTSLRFITYSGPLWFALALLVFSAAYAVARAIAGVFGKRPAATEGRMTNAKAVVLVAVIAAAAFAIRLVQPIGTSVVNMQLCYFPQYIALFITGIWAGRTGALERMTPRFGIAWLRLAFAAGVPAWFLLMGFGGALTGGVGAYMGGMTWQAAALAAWEAFIAVSMSLGLIALFRERFNGGGPVSRFLSGNCFGVYVFHAIILVTVSMAMRGIDMHPLAKAGTVLALALVGSYALAALVRAVPGLRKVFT